MSEVNKNTPNTHNFNHSSQTISASRLDQVDENNEEDKTLNNFCSFQVPVMLTPHEVIKL